MYAIDASGSVPDEYVALALRIAETPVRGVEQAIISFDAEVYPVEDRKVRGGGGTVVQKVEDWIRAGRHYPDRVFVFTDGEFEAPRLLFPHRWTWFLIEGGSCDAIPAEGRIETLKCIVALPIVVRRGEGADSAWVSQKTGYDKKMWIDMRGRGESIIN